MNIDFLFFFCLIYYLFISSDLSLEMIQLAFTIEHKQLGERFVSGLGYLPGVTRIVSVGIWLVRLASPSAASESSDQSGWWVREV